MIYDIGSRSLLFKRISTFLQETYLSTLSISDTYTLELAKCIYEYLRDFYGNRTVYYLQVPTKPDDFDELMSSNKQDKYFVKEYINNSWTGSYITAPVGSIWSGSSFYIKYLNLSIADIYVLGLPKYYYADNLYTTGKYYHGIQVKQLSSYKKEIKQASDVLNITAADMVFSQSNTVDFLHIFENPALANTYQQIATEDTLRKTGNSSLTDTEYSKLVRDLNYLVEQRSYFPKLLSPSSTIETVTEFIETGLNYVSDYNIFSWQISEGLLQYLFPDIVIGPESDEDDIASMQLLAEAINFVDYQAGIFDEDFEKFCKSIQSNLIQKDERVLITGYCDTFVEAELRRANAVRVEVY